MGDHGRPSVTITGCDARRTRWCENEASLSSDIEATIPIVGASCGDTAVFYAQSRSTNMPNDEWQTSLIEFCGATGSSLWH